MTGRTRIVRQFARLRRSERGSAMVELAVVLPVLVLIAIGVMDYGRVYFTSVAVANAARAGAEWGAFGKLGSHADNTNIQNFAKLDGAEVGAMTVTSGFVCRCPGDPNPASCNVECGGGYGAPGIFVTATATKTLPLILKYPGLPASITISRSATFRAQ